MPSPPPPPPAQSAYFSQNTGYPSAGFVDPTEDEVGFVLTVTPAASSLECSWPAQTGAVYYDVWCGRTIENLVRVGRELQATSYTIGNLTAGNLYYVQATANMAAQAGLASDTVDAIPLSPPPPPPSAVVGFVATFDLIPPGNTEPGAVQLETGSGPCSVDYQTVDGTATAGVDYTATSGTLNFGSSPQDINVHTMGPGLGRQFTIVLSNPVGCTIDSGANPMTVELLGS